MEREATREAAAGRHGVTRRLVLAGAAALATTRASFGQSWPERPVTLVVPYEPGGHSDIMARILAEYMTRSIGKPFVVENRSGAGGSIATTYVARAKPDGYTLLFGTVAQISIVPLVQKVTFDVERDFIPISLMGNGVIALVVNAGVPAKTTAELIAYAKANPGKLNYSSAGFGSFSHLGGAMFCSMAGIDMAHVPYKGAAPAVQAVMTGEVDIYIGNRAALMAPIENGKVRLLGPATTERVEDWPDAPVIADAVPGFEMDGWQGLLAPAGTPDEIVRVLERETMAACKTPEIIKQLHRMPANAIGSTSEAFAKKIRAERKLYLGAVKAAGIKRPG